MLARTENGYVFIPAHAQGPISIPDRRSPYAKADLLNSFVYSETDDMYIVYLEIIDTDAIDETIQKDIIEKGYRGVMDSGFEAVFYKESLIDQSGREKSAALKNASITINLEQLGILLEDASPEMIRNYYLAHNYDGENIEYLNASVSSDKVWATFVTNRLSPFALAYRDEKKPQPGPSYVVPVTGIR
ncbi:MAG: hypothetical protein IKF80_03435 [Erysipelotrichaceae bacterium]|nr:hypothetical protein [Erysipelotrichaceae bacterium]